MSLFVCFVFPSDGGGPTPACCPLLSWSIKKRNAPAKTRLWVPAVVGGGSLEQKRLNSQWNQWFPTQSAVVFPPSPSSFRDSTSLTLCLALIQFPFLSFFYLLLYVSLYQWDGNCYRQAGHLHLESPEHHPVSHLFIPVSSSRLALLLLRGLSSPRPTGRQWHGDKRKHRPKNDCSAVGGGLMPDSTSVTQSHQDQYRMKAIILVKCVWSARTNHRSAAEHSRLIYLFFSKHQGFLLEHLCIWLRAQQR